MGNLFVKKKWIKSYTRRDGTRVCPHWRGIWMSYKLKSSGQCDWLRDEDLVSREIDRFMASDGKAVAKLSSLFNEEGKELFIVGGTVRAFFLGDKPHDVDLCTNALPWEVTELLKKRGIKVVPTGLKHGTVTAYLNGEGYEITTFRKDSEYSDGLRPDKVEFSGTIDEDLSRRDFTFNAMAYNIQTGEIIDPFDGRGDLEKKIVKMVGDPDERLQENPIRLMRGIRFACQYGFDVEPKTMDAFKRNAFEVEDPKRFPREMIKNESDKALENSPIRYVDLMTETGMMERIMPEVTAMRGFEQDSPYHAYKLLKHTKEVMKYLPKESTIQWVALFHDMGKLSNIRFDEEKGHSVFRGHEKDSMEMSDKVMRRLIFSNTERRHIKNLIYYHMPHSGLLENRNKERVVKRWMVKVRENYKSPRDAINAKNAPYQLIDFFYAERVAKGIKFDEKAFKKQLDELRNTVTKEDTREKPKKMPVSGYDVMDRGYKGKDIGIQMAIMKRHFEEHPNTSKEKLMELMNEN